MSLGTCCFTAVRTGPDYSTPPQRTEHLFL